MKYPISYEEFEKKVFEKFLKLYTKSPSEEQENREILEEFLNGEGSNFMKISYKSSGAIYSQNIE